MQARGSGSNGYEMFRLPKKKKINLENVFRGQLYRSVHTHERA